MSAVSVESFGPATDGSPSQAFKAARLVKSKGDIKRSQRRAQGRYHRAGQPRLRRRLRCSSASAVADIGEDADTEWGVNRQDLFGVDPELAAAGAQRPIDPIIVAERHHLGDIGRLVRLVPNRQTLAIGEDRSRG